MMWVTGEGREELAETPLTCVKKKNKEASGPFLVIILFPLFLFLKLA